MSKYSEKSNCRGKHPFNKDRRKKCEAVKACISRGANFKGQNINWWEGYNTACNGNPDIPDGNTWLCKNNTGENLFNTGGWILCGFDPLTDGFQAKTFNESEAVKEKVQEQESKVILGVGALIALLVLYLVIK